jgi:hypothetical protein
MALQSEKYSRAVFILHNHGDIKITKNNSTFVVFLGLSQPVS